MKKSKVILVLLIMLVSGVSFSSNQSELGIYESYLAGERYVLEKNYRAAFPYLKTVLVKAISSGNSQMIFKSASMLGIIAMENNLDQTAIDYYEKALTSYSEEYVSKEVAQKILFNLGLLYTRIPDFKKSTAYFEQVMSVGGELAYAAANEVALNYINEKKYQKAYDLWKDIIQEDKEGTQAERAKYLMKKYLFDKGIRVNR